ncbi:PepSY domain-containing protein [Methanobacterium spitsbergense]|uniref:PepSY domain-containing protein n=1 Tax=Methanobacterium spitsbergense TaxID=2874285 RepID=A0A8T5UWC6_9EURY|nr:PepSY domain-containing protein [Methanobacterium spitsbergense]MBZ2165470.1 PepSY domain-containing protein [Methanobacterium spitsbergense]
MDKLNVVLIIAVIILVGMLGAAFGYMFLTNMNKTGNNSTLNQTNGTNVTNSTIPYTSEYISFSKAKSIAKSDAGKGVVTSDPILVKAKNGDAVYYSTYTYNGANIGGIIINAKTGAVLSNQQNIPTDTQNNNYNNNKNYDTGSSDSGSSDSGSSDSGSSGHWEPDPNNPDNEIWVTN